MDIKLRADRYTRPGIAVVIAASFLLAACGGDKEASATKPAKQVIANTNKSGKTFTFHDDISENNFVAACDGINRVYSDINGSGDLTVVPESLECTDESPPPRDSRITFNDDYAENNVVATCDGSARVYKREDPTSHSIPRSLVVIDNSGIC